ncbi:MAG: hypothetical protein M0R32_08440 [Candidatus Cloacimonetes bacterium]|jgi:hypothetical protein|nr:hypothetical protein [Candidatus Cloacimonadota bacterium]
MTNKHTLSTGMQSIINYMATKPGGLWVPEATTNRSVLEDNRDWGKGRTPQALHALVEKGLVIDEGKLAGDKQHYGFYALTDEARKLVSTCSTCQQWNEKLMECTEAPGEACPPECSCAFHNPKIRTENL